MSKEKGEEQKTEKLGQLSWKPGAVEDSLGFVFQHVSENAEKAIKWYADGVRFKKIWARILRVLAILFVSGAGLLPMLAHIITRDGKPLIPPVLASVFLLVAATIVLLDRFFGLSSAWMRYVPTELRIKQILKEFKMEWETKRAECDGEEPNSAQVQMMLSNAKAFVTEVDEIVRKETDEWVSQFQSVLTQLDKTAKK